MSERLQGLVSGGRTRGLIMPYLTAGYPRIEETLDLLNALEQGGADAVELGLPFSDPLADGPVIQETSFTALEGGVDHRKILELVTRFRRRSTMPLILMGYFNPILAFGPGAFFREARSAGADGLIVPDLPPEEAADSLALARQAGLGWIFLAAPTSTRERLATVDAMSTHFSYCVSLTGVTGARTTLAPDLNGYLNRAQEVMEKPFVVGFGFSRPEQVAQVVPPAMGVVVGSALLREIGDASNPGERCRRAESFVKQLRP